MRTTKVCPRCKSEKDIDGFRLRPSGTPHSWCIQCQNEWQKEHRKGREREKKDYQLQYSYGITIDDYEDMLKSQDYKCEICGDVFGDGQYNGPCVDHDHSTGAVRGLLCHACNHGLGKFKDSVIKLSKAIIYLDNHKGE
jgi:hypothetical protein